MAPRVLILFLCALSFPFAAGESPASRPANAGPVAKPDITRLLPGMFLEDHPAAPVVLGGRGSAFYAAAVEVLDKTGTGNLEFLEMSRHPSLYVRVAGMAGLAREGTAFGIKRLRELLASRESAPGLLEDGREVTIYESAIAWHFLTGTGYLCCRRTTPLLEEKEALVLALEALSRDNWAGAREPSYKGDTVSAPAAFIMERIKSGKLALTVESLRKVDPDAGMDELVKAVGRMPLSVAAPFLKEVLRDDNDQVTNSARLAAESALEWHLVEPGSTVDRAALLHARGSLSKSFGDSAVTVLDPANWRAQAFRWPEGMNVSPGQRRNPFFPIWAAWALHEPASGDTRPLVSSVEALATSVKNSREQLSEIHFNSWSAFRDTLFRLELRARHVDRHGEREFKPESARQSLLEAVRLCQPGDPSRIDPTDDVELIWKIHDLIKATPASASAGEMKAYTGTVPRAKDTPYRMVPIPGGEFLMGSPDSEKGRLPDEGPRMKVQIEPFWMGACEVTWDAYMKFMFSAEARSRDGALKIVPPVLPEVDAVSRPTAPYIDMTFGMGYKGYPALAMTQHAALKFCQWLSAQTGHFYRLPTEAEWEYAARAGTTTAWYWGNDPALLQEHGWFSEDSEVSHLATSHPVGLKKPSPWGLYDIYGNVAEWTLDQYSPDWYATQGAPGANRVPFNKPVRLHPRVIRGGSYDDGPALCRSASRRSSELGWNRSDTNLPKSRWYFPDCQFVGFRIVRPLKVPSPEEMYRIWNLGLAKEPQYN